MKSARPPESPQVLARRRWPLSLQEYRSPSDEAYLWGELPPGPYVAIVGRREASVAGVACAQHLARELGERGVTVVSGGALGIDSAAHQGALDVGAKTLVMAPVWFEGAYPTENRQVFRDIIERGGGYLTLATEDTPPLGPAFFRRNEALAALCQVLVVGECEYRSGAKNAFAHAKRLGRPTFVLPSLFGNSGGIGSNDLLNHGARVLLGVKQVVALLERLGTHDNPAWWTSPHASAPGPDSGADVRLSPGRPRTRPAIQAPLAATEPRPSRPGDELGLRVSRAVHAGATSVDDICFETELTAAVVQYQVLLLTLAGEVIEDPQGLLRWVPR